MFTKEGDVSFTFGALVDFGYIINQDKINIQTEESDSTQSDKDIFQQFSIEEETLTINSRDANEAPQIMKRAGIQKANTHPIVGNWTFKHYTGQTALMKFTSKGIMQLSVPLSIEEGSYSLQDNKLVIQFENREQIEMDYKRKGKILILNEGEGKKILEFQLFEY